MYLKSLEIHGFKSFADKTKLEFGPGITCIVGPNGSGKSNICDAFRWVLGEQSIKTLRGAKLEDVIFNGSESRKPLGMASVTLVFDNTSGLLPLAFDEVTVSRRVYRSGESEFLINKVPCRLKDIQDLFHDTGVGKEAFAIIGQGQIDAILSSRPEERRALFEEAAGIIRYRNRKLEAVRKLESTSANLDRLQDLLFELEQNLPPLKEEAEKAQKHQEWSRELETLEISLTCLDLEKLRAEREKVRGQAQDLEKRIWELEADQAKLTARLEESKLAKQSLEEQQGQLQAELYRRQKELSQNESEITIARDRLAAAQERESKIAEEQEQLRMRRVKLAEDCARLQEDYDRLAAAAGAQEEAVDEGEKQLSLVRQELATCREKDNMLKERLFDAEQKLVSLNNKQLELQFELKNLRQQSRKLRENEGTLERRRQELAEKLTANETRLAKYRERLVHCRQARQDKGDNQAKLQELLAQLARELEAVSRAKHSTASRIKVLEEMKENLEGYQAGVRNLLRKPVARGELPVLGVVGELLKVPSQYEKAIEAALGSAVQNLVTHTDADAQAAIEWLKKENAGRATFLPLNTLRSRPLAKEFHPLLGEEGVLGLASDLAEIVPGLEKVLDYLLGNIIVVRDLSTGRLLARKSRFSLKIVTLDGDILFPGGSMTGGSHKTAGSGLFGRNREIGEQQSLLNKLEAEEQELRDKIRQAEEQKAALAGQWQQLGEEISRLEMEITGLEQEKERLQRELAQQQTLMEQGRWEEQQLAEEEGRWQRQLAEVEEAKQTAAAQKEEITREVQQNKAREGELEEEIRSLTARLTEQKVSLASQREKLHSLADALRQSRQNHREAMAAEERLQEELRQTAERKETLEASLALLAEKERSLLTECHGLDNRQREITARVQEVQAEVAGLEARVGQLARELKEWKEQQHRVAMQLTRLEVEWENGAGRLQEKFRLTWEEAKEKQVPLVSRREAETRVKNLRKQLEELGPVNPNAVAEYQRLEERYRFLKNQQEDLLAAREGLFKVIEEMEKIMGQRFRKTFKEVETAFQEVFAYLFEGGKAALQLTDEDRLLESGIEIIAQPPGKKMQNLSLLSGGERALTATALLFALLKVKPSPFCVLDEIEANLDEANVDRVARYLKELAQETQFILVSHRQGTMEVADALYGVTMEESGVSRLVSVRLAPAAEVG